MIRCSRTAHRAVHPGKQVIKSNGHLSSTPHRSFTTTRNRLEAPKTSNEHHVDIKELLSKPTWSVFSLLPPKETQEGSPKVTPEQLRHLLRLSALPPPKTAEEESKLLSSLSSHLHFVREIQSVDTAGVEPLRSLRDETAAGEKEAELGLDALKEALELEEVRGKHHKRIRRRRTVGGDDDTTTWDPLATAGRKTGRFFVVEAEKEGS